MDTELQFLFYYHYLPSVCQLGDFTGCFLPRDGRTGLKLITESGVKRRSTSGVIAPATGQKEAMPQWYEEGGAYRQGQKPQWSAAMQSPRRQNDDTLDMQEFLQTLAESKTNPFGRAP